MKYFLTLFVFFLFISCAVLAQAPFTPVKFTTNNKVPVLPEEYEYSILFREGDYVYTSPTEKSLAKKNHDYVAFIPGHKKDMASLYVSHETNDTSAILGDGGGGTIFDIRKSKGKWERSGANYNIDFKTVGGTFDNCGGLYIKETNRVLIAEEFPPENNSKLYKKGKGTRDTSDVNTLKRYQNTGWIVEVDPSSKKAIKKLYALGRYSHESLCMSKDGTTLYMTDDNAPAVLFKFIAKKAFHFDEGNLFAFDQNRAENPWISLPRELDSLLNVREIALRKGATAFMRLEWMTLVNDKIYITETGFDRFEFEQSGLKTKQLAFHLQSKLENGVVEYPYGAMLELDLNTQKISTKLSGGRGTVDVFKHFSNPDAITHLEYEGKTWLIICEDIIGKDKQRVIAKEGEASDYTNEVWWLDTSIPNPRIEDLHRFLIAVPGAECTGVCFSPDGETLFLNIQHPSASNTYPFDKSSTLAIHRKKRTRGKTIGNKRPQDGFGITIPF